MKKNKLTNRTILIIVLTSFALLFLGLSIITSVINVNRTKNSIDNIGEVSLSIETEEKIDQAIVYYEKLDRNIGLEKKVKNANALADAKANYVRLAIKKAIVLDNRKVADEISNEEITLAVNEATTKLEKYFSESEYETITGYSEFKYLQDKYGTKKEDNSSNTNTNQNSSNEEIEIC
jgi:hypothetical protein